MATAKKATATKTAAASKASAASKPATADMPGLDQLAKMVKQFKVPGIDVAAIIESQRQDMEALAEANRQAYEGMKALAQRRNEILMKSLTQWQDAMKDATGKDALTAQGERARKMFQQAVDDMRELAEMETQSRGKAWKVVQDRFQQNVANLQKLTQSK